MRTVFEPVHYNYLLKISIKYSTKVNGVCNDNKTINVTKLDIDDYGSVVLLEELVLQLPESVLLTVTLLLIS
jgi:hypothetical protein